MKKIKNIIFISLIVSFFSCDDFVQVSPPNTQLNGADVFESRNTALAALMNMYAKMRDAGILSGRINGSGALLGMYADELTYHGGNDGNTFNVFNTTLQEDTPVVTTVWNQAYHVIYCSNAIIEGCENSTSLTINEKNQFIGEALFARAWTHFTLANIFGDIPYLNSTDYQINRIVSRTPIQQVYNNVLNDLELAINLLSENYQGTGRSRVNKAAASALYARVLLYNKNWNEAITQASIVINNPNYAIVSNLNNVFLSNSQETILHYSPNDQGNNAHDASVYIFNLLPPSNLSISDVLFSSFNENDLRRSNWIRTLSNENGSWSHAFKYKINTNTSTSQELSVAFRLAEMYLIRAEARLNTGDIIGGRSDLNIIRERAGVELLDTLDLETLLEALLNERKWELFTEHGHRFFDLKRSGKLNTVMNNLKPAWASNKTVWPIPLNEILLNPNMTQNPGY